ncbi:DUF2690 domain-containing protein [Kitasatospora sp. NPDC004745]|uniref:DUF2690 domain-containing protein n=1 Tax=Kitasatospora sp. NPDC004745 TaxID=3364019 RepID=UPI003677F149
MSKGWQPFPDDLSDESRALAEELRAVKDAHRLSFADLGRRTGLSKASWERWTNGKRLIGEQALDALIAAVECDGDRLHALLRRAEAARQPGSADPGESGAAADGRSDGRSVGQSDGRSAAEPVAEAVPAVAAVVAPPVVARRWRPAALLGLAVAAVLALLAVLSPGDRGDRQDRAAPPPPATATDTGPAPLCQGTGCEGKDPHAMGCDADERTVMTGNVGKVILYVHYSHRCRAAWAGITDGGPGDSATITTGTGLHETALIHWGYDNYSAMVDASPADTTLRVCGTQQNGSACTETVSDPATRAAVLTRSADPEAAPTGR